MLRNGEGIGCFTAAILCVQRGKSQREGVYPSQDHERVRLHASPSALESLTASSTIHIPTLCQQDGERGVLLFTATMTVVRNGRVQEVPFDTQAEAFGLGIKQGATLSTVPARETEGRKVHRGWAKV